MKTSKSKDRVRASSLFAIVLLLFGLVISAPPTQGRTQEPQVAECQSGIGGHLFATGGEVEVEIIASNAGFTIELSLMSPGPQRFVATNRDPGSIVRLGSFPAGVELIFGVLVRDTQNNFLMGSGSGNPDGLPHAQVACFDGKRSAIGFEDQLGGGDQDYDDLLFSVRQPLSSCTYSISPSSQSYDSGGGSGGVTLNASSGCSWTAASNVSWITITSGGSGSDSGTVNYSVALNTSSESRTGTIVVQGQTFSVFQDATGSQPVITSTLRSKKKMFIYGINFDSGSVILLNGEVQKTLHDDSNPRTVLIGKKVGKWAQPGDKIRVRSSLGALSAEYTYAP